MALLAILVRLMLLLASYSRWPGSKPWVSPWIPDGDRCWKFLIIYVFISGKFCFLKEIIHIIRGNKTCGCLWLLLDLNKSSPHWHRFDWQDRTRCCSYQGSVGWRRRWGHVQQLWPISTQDPQILLGTYTVQQTITPPQRNSHINNALQSRQNICQHIIWNK